MKPIFLILFVLLSCVNCKADDRFSFFAGNYYFELNYGLVFNKTDRTHKFEFLSQSKLSGTAIVFNQYKSILRVEINNPDVKYESFVFEKYTQTAKMYPNPENSLLIAYLGEYIFLMSLDYQIVKAYQNTYFKKWLNNEEILVNVTDGSGNKLYGTSDYVINVVKNTAIKITP